MNSAHRRTLASGLIAAAMALFVLLPASPALAATADLSVTVVASNTPELNYAIAVHNGGPDPATSVMVLVTLPAGIIPISVTPDGPCAFNAAGTQVNCALGSIANGATATVTVVVHAVTIGTKTATATASAAETEPTPGDNSHSDGVTLTEVGIAEMMVTLDDGPDPLNVGETLTYTAVVTNVQDDSGQDVVLSVVLPIGVTFSSARSDRGRCGHLGRLVTCKLGVLNPGTSSTATIKIIPKNPGYLHAAAGVATSSPDPSFANNSAAVRTWVNP
jgi:uncharacterized repeat protein (TIGR01451 family)